MGDPRKPRKQYDMPKRPWDRERIDKERKITATFGLKNKKEIRKLETILRRKRENARKLLGLPLEKRVVMEKELISSLENMGLLKGNASLDDVLGLKLEEILERRLETKAWRLNLAKTVKQARQFITHGHIAVNGRKVTAPGYLLKADEDSNIGYFGEPMQLEPPKPEKKADLKKAFEEAAGIEPEKEGAEESAAEGERKPVKTGAEGERKTLGAAKPKEATE